MKTAAIIKKEDLRRVEFKHSNMGMLKGYFHGFYIDYNYECGAANIPAQHTTALVELDNGQVLSIPPTDLCFID